MIKCKTLKEIYFLCDNYKLATIKLPKKEIHKCTICDGTGSYIEYGNLHESTGVVPCNCDNGIITTKIVYIPKKYI